MPALLSKLLTPQSRLPVLLSVFKRHGHARVLFREANQTTWLRMKDHMHFYCLIAILFWGGIVTYQNVKYGQCQLVDIPDDYEPRYWEYERSPVVRLFHRWGDKPAQFWYEEHLGEWENWTRRVQWEREENRARRLMFERQDYKAWYYVPYRNKWIEYSNWQFEAYKRKVPAFLTSLPS